MEKVVDLTLMCNQCGKEFVFSVSEQEFFKEKGFELPRHCRPCRTLRKNHPELICSKCAAKLPGNSSVFCPACFEKVQEEFESEARKLAGALNEYGLKLAAAESELSGANTQLNSLESEKSALAGDFAAKFGTLQSETQDLLEQSEARLGASRSDNFRLAASLEEEKRLTASLRDQLAGLKSELEKSLKYRTALDWLEPASRTLTARLDALERQQMNLNNSLQRLIQKTERPAEHAGLSGVFRRIFQPRPTRFES